MFSTFIQKMINNEKSDFGNFLHDNFDERLFI